MSSKRLFAYLFAAFFVGLTAKPALALEPLVGSLSGSFSLGREDAPVTLVEFSDYDCFYCRRHALQILPLIYEKYVKPGKLRYVVLEFPPVNTESTGFRASEAALCAADQGQYWKMRALLFEEQENLSTDSLIGYGETLGLDKSSYDACLAERRHRDRALQTSEIGEAAGIHSVPMFYLGTTDHDNPSRFRALKWINGSKIFSVYADAIDNLLLRAQTSE